MRYRSFLAFVAACAALSACQGLKDALTAHVDVAASAGSQQLSVTRLGDLVGHAKVQVPSDRNIVGIVAHEFWVDYQLAAQAAAKGDSLTNPKQVDEAIVTVTSTMRLHKIQDTLMKALPKQEASEVGYNQGIGGIYAARHILFAFPATGPTPGTPVTQGQRDSVKKVAEGVLAKLNDKNFAEMAKKYPGDPGSAAQGGSLGIAPIDPYVQPFKDALKLLKPGETSKLVETQFGYHIIERMPYAAVKAQYDSQFPGIMAQSSGAAFAAKVDSDSKIEVRPGAPALAKAAAIAEDTHRNDGATLATFKGGKLTVARFLVWLDGMDPRQRIPQAMQTAPDSVINPFLKKIALNEVFLKKADSMKIEITADEKKNLYHDFGQLVVGVWGALNVDPKSLADSAKSEPERERLAAARVESLLDHLMAGDIQQPVPVPIYVKILLESNYRWKINQAGIDRAAERARTLRLTDDSVRAANQPKSQVPLPGGPPGAANAPPPGGKAPPPPTKGAAKKP